MHGNQTRPSGRSGNAAASLHGLL